MLLSVLSVILRNYQQDAIISIILHHTVNE